MYTTDDLERQQLLLERKQQLHCSTSLPSFLSNLELFNHRSIFEQVTRVCKFLEHIQWNARMMCGNAYVTMCFLTWHGVPQAEPWSSLCTPEWFLSFQRIVLGDGSQDRPRSVQWATLMEYNFPLDQFLTPALPTVSKVLRLARGVVHTTSSAVRSARSHNL